MAGTNLALIERDLTLRLPMLAETLPKSGSLDAQRLMRTAIMAAERNPEILTCTMESIVSSTVTAAVIGLELDGVTGQGFLVPFNDNKARVTKCQFMMGYKGYNTIGARSNLTINSGVVREGDEFDFDLGEGWVRHKPSGSMSKPITWSWAKASTNGRPPILRVMSREAIDIIRKKSKGGGSGFSPWNDAAGPGFSAMAEKSAIRQLGRNLPVIGGDHGFQRAAALEGAQEAGNLAWLRADGALEQQAITPAEPLTITDMRPEFRWTMADDTDRVWKTANAWATMLAQQLPTLSDAALQGALDRNVANIKAVLDAGFVDEHMTAMRVFVERGIFPTAHTQAIEN